MSLYPTVLSQLASTAQSDCPVTHSSTSSQVVPLPTNPSRHEQLKEPTVLRQLASGAQLFVPSAHSLGSGEGYLHIILTILEERMK